MLFIWATLSFMVPVSALMLVISLFTPKTAFFFGNKTKLRGALLWLCIGLASALIVGNFAPPAETFKKEDSGVLPGLPGANGTGR